MPNKNTQDINNKSLIRIVEVLQIEDNLDIASKDTISRNNFGRRIKVRLFEDEKTLNQDCLPWVWPLLPKHLQVMPKVGELVLVFFANIDGVYGNRFYIGPIISQDYYLDNGGTYEAMSLLQGVGTKPLCHPQGNSKNDGTYPESDTIAIQGRGDAAMWLKDEEMRLMCGHKPGWRRRSIIERADPGSLEFNKNGIGDDDNKENLYRNMSYIQLKFDSYKSSSQGKTKQFGSVANIVADRIHLVTHEGASHMNIDITDQKELMTKDTIEKVASNAQSVVYGEDLIQFLQQFRQVFRDHTHHWANDKQVECTKDEDFWGKNLNELLCKTIKIV